MTRLDAYLKQHLHNYHSTGGGYSMACCPFHKDNTPSLSVTQRTGNYRCFSCGARGDLALLIVRVERAPLVTAIAKARQLRSEVRHG